MTRATRIVLSAGLILVLAAAAAAGLGAWAWKTLHRPFKGYPGDQAIVEVAPGSGGGSILRQLEHRGVIADADLARVYLRWVLDDPPLQAGEYRFSGPAGTPEILDKLIRGEVVAHGVTVIEGLTLEETATHLAASGFGDLDRFLEEMRSPRRITGLDPEAEDLEGYLFPDSYAFSRGTSEARIVDAIVANFQRRWRQGVAPLLAADGDPVEPRRLVTLASIVEKETSLDVERPVVAGVYANRLRRGIGLYADPTVIYALKKLGRWDGNLRREDLRLESPFNTYRVSGLPPSPICSPGLASLAAAARPADVPYLYFVSRNDGSHVFASSLAEHNRNVETFQRRYWRERWAKERAESGGND